MIIVLVLKFVLELAAKFFLIKRSSYPSYGMELQKNIQNRKITGKIEEKNFKFGNPQRSTVLF
jgi:hypothetical protein